MPGNARINSRISSVSSALQPVPVFEDQLFRVTFRAEPDEVMAFEHLGAPYFRAGWGRNVVGMLLDDDTDWDEVAELLTESYCTMAPGKLAALVDRPET